MHEGVFVQINPYLVGQHTLDGDGLYGETPFDSLNELARLSGWNGVQMSALIERLKALTS